MNWMTDREKSLVQEDDKVGIVSTETGAIPDQSINQMEIDSVTYQLLGVRPLKPGPVVMLYYVHCRK